jgi:hypothetical protein
LTNFISDKNKLDKRLDRNQTIILSFVLKLDFDKF